MTKTPKAIVPVLLTAAAVAAVLTGCASAAPPSGIPSGSRAPAVQATAAPVHQQGKLAGVPKECLSADDVSLSAHQSLPHLAMSGGASELDCDYYGQGGADHPVVQLVYTPLSVSAAEWKSKSLAAAGSVVVKGIGDDAVYVETSKYNVMSFLSGATVGNIITTPIVDRSHVIALAESMLEG